MSVVRTSKYRHIFCDAPKAENVFSELRLSSATGDQSYIKTNGTYFSIALQGGGGPFTCIPLDKPGRIPMQQPCFTGHSGPVNDTDFHPFLDNMVASGSDDSTVKVWSIPDGGLTANINDPMVDLTGHGRRVIMLQFNPNVSNILASASKDSEVKLWDISTGACVNSNTANTELIQDLCWDYVGGNYATATKDKKISLFDARSTALAGEIKDAHLGSKSVKMCFAGDTGRFVSVGFTSASQGSMREFKIWDTKNLSVPVHRVAIDNGSGAILPFFDEDASILYLAGKGDTNVRYYELHNASPWVSPIADFRSKTSCKGMAWVPKRKMDVMKCETARLIKLTTNTAEPLSFTVPRKSDTFQDDLFPDTLAGVAACSSEEWLAGANKNPVKMSLDPAKNGRLSTSTAPITVFVAPKTAAALQVELDAAEKRIKELEARLAAAGLETE